MTTQNQAQQRPPPQPEQLSFRTRQLSQCHRQLSPPALSLALGTVLLFCAGVASACDPLNNCNAEGYCCCSNSVFYSARPVGQDCQKHFRAYMLAVIILPVFVGVAICLLVTYWQRKRLARLRPNAHPTQAEMGAAPVPYIAGPGAYSGGPGRYSPGPGAYQDASPPYQGAPGGYQSGSVAYVGGPGAYAGGPGTYRGGLLPGYGQEVYGTPVTGYPSVAQLPEDRFKESTAPYRGPGNQ